MAVPQSLLGHGSEREMSGLTQRPIVDLGFISGPMLPEDNSTLLFHRKHGINCPSSHISVDSSPLAGSFSHSVYNNTLPLSPPFGRQYASNHPRQASTRRPSQVPNRECPRPHNSRRHWPCEFPKPPSFPAILCKTFPLIAIPHSGHLHQHSTSMAPTRSARHIRRRRDCANPRGRTTHDTEQLCHPQHALLFRPRRRRLHPDPLPR